MGVRVASGEGAFEAIAAHVGAVSRRVVLSIVAEGETMVAEEVRTGKDERGHVGRVDRGLALQSVQVGPLEEFQGVVRGSVVTSGPSQEYWPVIEDGRRPGRPVSREGVQRITTWVRRKLLPGVVAKLRDSRSKDGKRGRVAKDEQARLLRSLVYAVVRAIRTKGTPGLAPFRKAALRLRGGRAREIWREIVGTA